MKINNVLASHRIHTLYTLKCYHI